MRLLYSVGIGLVGILAQASVSIAHGLQIQAQIQPQIEIQAHFDSGDPIVNAQVQVFAPNDPKTPILTGRTDSQGKYQFKPQESGNWEVSIRQAGHGEIAVIPVDLKGNSVQPVATAGPNPLQQVIVIGSVVWGCLGTALYFRRSNA